MSKTTKSKNQKAEKIVLRLSRKRFVISMRDDIIPAFKKHRALKKAMTFAVWNLCNRGVLKPLGRNAYFSK